MGKTELPKKGTRMFFVAEHFYRIPEHAAPLLEYCVCDGNVSRYNRGRYTEIVILSDKPDGYWTPHFFKSTDIGEKVFYTKPEAIRLAEQMADKYDRTWGWTKDGLIRRPWRIEKKL